MGLEGFWVFVFIIVASILFILIMTGGKDDATDSDDEGEIAP